jgi:superfamily II DNA or RNA helicase
MIKPQGKTYLSHRGYAIEKQNNEKLIEKLKNELTVSPKINPMMINTEETSFPVYRENDKKIYLPRCYGLSKFGIPDINQLNDGQDCPNLIFAGTLREAQLPPVEAFIEAVNDLKRMGGLLSLPCGFGKTICALYLSSHFKKKTLIICHTNFLIDQWIERIQQYIPTAKVGKIKQNKCEIDGRDIVIASLQSISMRDYDTTLFEQFGFVISDECHHISAEVFSRCLPKITNKRMLGLSATLKRKDGLSKVFEWFIGKSVYEIKRKDSEVKILIKRYYDPHTAYSKEAKIWNSPNKLNVAKMINNICAFAPRNYLLVQTLKDILQKEPNRKVLILSERRNHLQEIEILLKIEKYESIGYYVGGMNKQQLDEGSQADIILATFQLASEAMDIPKLNTLVLGSPVSSIEQPIGRIQRKKKEEREYIPLVIDILDEFSLFERQGMKRIVFYTKNGYEIEDPVKAIKDNLKEAKKYTLVEDEDDINIVS